MAWLKWIRVSADLVQSLPGLATADCRRARVMFKISQRFGIDSVLSQTLVLSSNPRKIDSCALVAYLSFSLLSELKCTQALHPSARNRVTSFSSPYMRAWVVVPSRCLYVSLRTCFPAQAGLNQNLPRVQTQPSMNELISCSN